jgi:hypothetical protein
MAKWTIITVLNAVAKDFKNAVLQSKHNIDMVCSSDEVNIVTIIKTTDFSESATPITIRYNGPEVDSSTTHDVQGKILGHE